MEDTNPLQSQKQKNKMNKIRNTQPWQIFWKLVLQY